MRVSLRAGGLLGLTVPATLTGAAMLLGAATAYAAYVVHPIAIPALVTGAGIVVIGTLRPDAGVAAALVLLALGGFGVLSPQLPLVVSVLAVYLLAAAVLTGRVRSVPTGALVLAGLFLATALLSFVSAPEVEGRQLLRALVTALSLAAVVALTVREQRQVVTVLAGAAVSALLVGGHATFEYLTGEEFTHGFVTESGVVIGRVTAGFAQPNQLGGYLAVLIPLALAGALLHARWRALYVAALVLACMGVYSSFSRSALLALGVVPLAFLGLRRVILLVPVLVVLSVALAPDLLEERFATLTASGSELATRADIWRASVVVWAEDPLIGAGLARFPEEYVTARVPGKDLIGPGGDFEPPAHAHNVFLHLLAEQGLLGLAVFAALLAAGLWTAIALRRSADVGIRRAAAGLTAAMAVFVLHNQFDVTLFQSETGAWFWTSMGLVVALLAMRRDDAKAGGAAHR